MKIYKFGASWCKPCATLEPIFNKVVGEFSQLESEHVDCEDDSKQDLVEKFQIRNLPTIIVTDGEKVLYRNSGLVTESALRDKLTSLLN